jgi:hypothetical protein
VNVNEVPDIDIDVDVDVDIDIDEVALFLSLL